MASYESILKAIDDTIDAEISTFNLEMTSVLARLSSLLVDASIESYSDPLEFDAKFSQILEESGYYDTVSKFINESYDKSYPELISMLSVGGVYATLSEADKTDILAIKQLDLDFFSDIGNEASQILKRDLYNMSISNTTKTVMIENMKKTLEGTRLFRYSSTYAETSISKFHQSVIDMKLAEVTEPLVYIYIGATPDDKIRDFCRCLMNRHGYYSKSDGEIIKADSRRYYNCRHFVTGVSLEFAKLEGYEKASISC